MFLKDSHRFLSQKPMYFERARGCKQIEHVLYPKISRFVANLVTSKRLENLLSNCFSVEALPFHARRVVEKLFEEQGKPRLLTKRML